MAQGFTQEFKLGDGSALKNPSEKRQINRAVFKLVAPKYQLITRILSFGRDQAWKRELIASIPQSLNPVCLDLACGTGDIGKMLAAHNPSSRIMAIDICSEMLRIASHKKTNQQIYYVLADMLSLPVADNSVDIITGGYALRNAPDLDVLLAVIYKKLKPGGSALFLDFSRSANPSKARWQAKLLTFWTQLWGILLHGNADVYGYIAKSLALYPNCEELRQKILAQGFREFSQKQYLGGFTAMIKFKK